MFKDKVLLLTGGTGSFGNAVAERFLHTDIKEIRIFSRDEKKQEEMRMKFNHPKLTFYVGDVRDRERVRSVMRGVDYVFHAAALKQVPSCEFFPAEAVKTNVFGTENVLDAAIEAKVEKVICLSTDKAVYPINAMGISKAMMEKVFVSYARHGQSGNTVICGTRYGNVMCSRGSVIPLFMDQIKAGKNITITDPNMTRFLMSLADAVELVIYAFIHGQKGDIFVQKAPATSIEVLAEALQELFDVPKTTTIIGTRHGEKLYESLVSSEEMIVAEDLNGYYKIANDKRSLNYSIDADASRLLSEKTPYNSDNTYRLNKEETKAKLLELQIVRDAIEQFKAQQECEAFKRRS